MAKAAAPVEEEKRPETDEVFPEEPTDWVAEKHDPDAGKEALDAIIDARVQAMRRDITAQVLSEIAQAQLDAQSKPSLTMQAKVHDKFFDGRSAGTGKPLKHYRCDSAISVKCDEFDMKLLTAYESGEKERPVDSNGRPRPATLLAAMTGQHINWVDGHCYCYTENQVLNIERLIERGKLGLSGGMTGIYEDEGDDQQWPCHVCPPGTKVFGSQRTYANHMQAVHGVVVAEAA